MYNKVIWSEGMFLTPQHFQQQDRYFEFHLRNSLPMLHPYAWGFDELELDQELLSLGRVKLKKCRGILPDGTLFDIPNVDMSPEPLQISEGSQEVTIYLGIPLRQSHTLEVSDNANNSSLVRYKSFSSSLADNTSSDINDCVDVQLGKLCLGLLHSQEECQGYSMLAIAKIREVAVGGVIRLDENFIPPFLNAKNNYKINHYIEESLGLLHYRGEMLAQRVVSPGDGELSEISDFMILQVINRYEPIFQHFLKERLLSPPKLYENLLSLLGELATFTQKNRRLTQSYPYYHEDLQKTFEPLMSDLRDSLTIILNQNAKALDLEKRDVNLWCAKITEKPLLESSEFILAVHAQLSNEEIRQKFPNCLKICPVEEIDEFISHALPGIKLELLSVAPRKIPFHAGYTYFRLNKKDILWKKFQESMGIAFHISGQFPELKLELWAIQETDLKI